MVIRRVATFDDFNEDVVSRWRAVSHHWVGFAIPRSEPDVRVSPHPALYAQLTGCG
jgi:hypothetical protein